jgi:peroxiredoxin
VRDDLYTLPEGLPVPEDDGAADHLEGARLPDVELVSTAGPLRLSSLPSPTVVYLYPRAGRPDRPMLPGWNETPGARGCTPQACAFRDADAELRGLGAAVVGVSAQPLDDQLEFVERNRLPFPIVADPELLLARELGLPTFDIAGLTLYRRLTLVAVDGAVEKVFYPVFPPDRNAADVVDWLRGFA